MLVKSVSFQRVAVIFQGYRRFPIKRVCKVAYPGQDSSYLLQMLGSSAMNNSLDGWQVAGAETRQILLC